jgi:2-polyprenyl-6-methoxyphenol hydroxylase-like FAD-dependent oxidoreductase
MASEIVETSCCIVGGGPAGMMLGYLLARRGVAVTVLEKHKDFFRDFRGDTVHPSTLEVLKELGLLEELLKLPHQEVKSLGVVIGDALFEVADFSHVPTFCKFVALMPQWDFLNFLSRHAELFPSFQLLMRHEAVDLITEKKRIVGVVARTGVPPRKDASDNAPNDSREVHIRADLVVGCDGRHSVIRRAAALEVIEHGVPIDVLWFRISRRPDDPAQVLGNVNYGKAMILIDRSDYFQAGLIIAKGSYDSLRARGIDAFRAGILQVAPWLGERVNELRDWDQIKILTVQINRLARWHRPGLLCIGDAAHAMSPAGGVGINLAIQDAVAAANLLAAPLKNGRPSNANLAAVQRRREFPTRVTQAVQVVAHRGIANVFANPGPIQAPWQLKAIQHVPGIHRALGYAVGVGARPEHVHQNTRTIPWRAGLAAVACAAVGGAAAAAVCGWVAWKVFRKIAAAST